MPARLDHVTITTPDFEIALTFYDAVLGALGWSRVLEFGDEEEDDADLEAAAWAPPDEEAVLWLVAGPTATAGLHLALDVPDRDDVVRFHDAALVAGGRNHDAPRRWPIYRRGRFNAIVADPAGNLIEAIAPE